MVKRKRHKKRKPGARAPATGAERGLVELWALRALEGGKLCPARMRDSGHTPGAIEALMEGLEPCKRPRSGCDREGCPLRARRLEAEEARPGKTGLLFENVGLMAELLGLSEVEQEVLALGVLLPTEELLQEVFEGLTGGRRGDLTPIVAHAIGREVEAVRAALSREGRLMRAEMIELWPEEEDEEETECPS